MKLQKIISVSPHDYTRVGDIDISSSHTIDKAVSHARHAQPSWQNLGIKKRIEYLQKLYHAFDNNKDALGSIAAKEMGMPITIGREIDINIGLQYCAGYLEHGKAWIAPEIVFENDSEIHTLYYEPRGVAAISVPWNYPFLLFIWAVIQNLVVGNTVVFKHSEECALTGKLIEDIVKSVQLPDGVFNAIYGDGYSVGEYLMNSDIDLIYFTGSTAVGKHLYQVAAKKNIPVLLELGGSAPGIIFDDADLESALESVYFNRYVNSGQSCDALKRLIVHRSIYNQVIDGLKKIISSKKVGNPLDPKTDLGPLVAQRQLEHLEEQVHDAVKKGGKILVGGKRPAGLTGAYYEPTLIDNISFDMKIWKEEVFGPVLPIVPFSTDEEAIALANDTIYGLGGFVYTANRDRAYYVISRLKTGNICVNGTSYVIVQDPFGGYKNSGIGREHGKPGLQELCQIKVVAQKK